MKNIKNILLTILVIIFFFLITYYFINTKLKEGMEDTQIKTLKSYLQMGDPNSPDITPDETIIDLIKRILPIPAQYNAQVQNIIGENTSAKEKVDKLFNVFEMPIRKKKEDNIIKIITGSNSFTTTSSNNKIYYGFTSGTYTLNGKGTVTYLLIGGGGGGGISHGGGGGAGGVISGTIQLSGTTTITVGAGGGVNTNGQNSILSVENGTTITAYGGGYGGGHGNGNAYSIGSASSTIGSGGGGSGYTTSQLPGLTSSGQGNKGGPGVIDRSYHDAGGGGGGGGAGTEGTSSTISKYAGGLGGDGTTAYSRILYAISTKMNAEWNTATNISGTFYIAAGGGGGTWGHAYGVNSYVAPGGKGGGGKGGTNNGPVVQPVAPVNNTGSGGGGGGSGGQPGTPGASGLVILIVSSSSITQTRFTPTSISGLTNWYDASDPNANGVIPSNGETINTWTDKSPNKNNMIAQTPGTYATNSQNGLGTVTFNNSWYRTATANATYPFDVYIVVKLNSTTAPVDILGSGNKYSDNFNSLTFSEHTTGRWHNGSSYFYRTPNAVASTSETSTDFLLMQWSVANNNFYIYRNGLQIVNTNAYTWGGISNQEFRLGNRHYDPTPNLLKGSIAELIIYNYQLQTDDRKRVEDYLAEKWGININ